MFKRPDSDIFGTKQLSQHAKIKNDSYVDPNEAFKKRNDQNYQRYSSKLGNIGRNNIQGNPEMTKVNERVAFDEQYHKSRKFQDLQSSIFYEQKQYKRPQTTQEQRHLKQKTIVLNEAEQIHYGRKNTIKRQISNLPHNQSNMKGNASQLFDFDPQSQKNIATKDQSILLPYKMQWDQHDSIRYQHNKNPINTNILTNEQNIIQKTEQTHSTQDPTQQSNRKQTLRQMKSLQRHNVKEQEPKKGTIVNDGKKYKQKQKLKQDKVKTVQTLCGDVEVRVIKGWDNKFMEGLIKYCKLYSTPMTKFQVEGPGKATILLKRTKKWESVTDWLTKDAKLKIRVMSR